MNGIKRHLQQVLFGAAVLASLGFGATQALATPQAAAEDFCDPKICNSDCMKAGYAGGECWEGSCYCF